jgi:hypothetical protein
VPNAPAAPNARYPLQQPHPPIMIGGSRVKKTLRLVAQYGDACNLFTTTPTEVQHKLDVLAMHCDTFDRGSADVRRTIITGGNPLDDVPAFIGEMQTYATMGIDLVAVAPTTDDPATFATELDEQVVHRLLDLG